MPPALPAFFRFLAGLLLASLLASQPLRAQSVLYITDGNSASQHLQAIDTTTGNITFSANTVVNPGDQPFALAVRNSIWIISTYASPTKANEYSLSGVSTGNTVNLPPSLPSQFLDGTTDGSNNYTLAWNSSGNVDVFKANGDWTNLSVLFNTGSLNLSGDIAGIAYDFVSGNLWLAGATTLYQVSLTGALVSQFAHAGGRGSLAYQPSTDSLWFVPNSASSPLLQYSKTGTQLQSLTVNGRSGNVWGAEFQMIPEPSTYVLLGLGLAGLFWRNRRRLC